MFTMFPVSQTQSNTNIINQTKVKPERKEKGNALSGEELKRECTARTEKREDTTAPR
eukprot:m.81418 g.81418  ORF g.81418 m.81418 type:complete len:57 (+) comp14249_c0_seq1:309-479(+)